MTRPWRSLFPPYRKGGNCKAQSLKLKYELINYLVIIFNDTFNKSGVTSKVGAYLKYVRDQ